MSPTAVTVCLINLPVICKFVIFSLDLLYKTQILHCYWLPEWTRWGYLACSGLPTVPHKNNFPESHILVVNPSLTKLVRSRWLELGQYPAILTSHLVNNPNIMVNKIGKLCFLRRWPASVKLIALFNVQPCRLQWCMLIGFFLDHLQAIESQTIVLSFCYFSQDFTKKSAFCSSDLLSPVNMSF